MSNNKFKLSKPVKVIDLYEDYLPSDGEDRLQIKYSDGILDIKIQFHSKISDLEEEIILRFHSAFSFVRVPFPGQNLFDECLDNSCSFSLIEYQKSEFIEKTEIYRVLGFIHKHYRIFFHSQKNAMYVTASSVEVIEVR